MNELKQGADIMYIRVFMLALTCVFLMLPPQLVLAGESSGPRLPYYDWDACPFECCTYRQWTANADVTVRKSPRKNAPTLFKIRKGEDMGES